MSMSLSPQPPFDQALQVSQVKRGKFLAEVPSAFCFGKRAHGGLLISLAQKTASLHKPGQCDVLELKIHFLSPVEAGGISIDIQDLSDGKRTSVVELKASQGRKLVLAGLLTLGNLSRENGVSFDTGWSLVPVPTAVSISQLALDSDPRWVSYQCPWHPKSYRRPQSYAKWFVPLDLRDPSYRDSWITPGDPNASFKTEHLGFVGDMTLPILDNFCGNKGYGSHSATIAAGMQQKQERDRGLLPEPDVDSGAFTTPITSVTMSFNMEIKKRLPVDGTKWLFTRSQARCIANGRMDNEIHILDEGGDIVAIVQQVHQVVDIQKAVGALKSPSKM